MKRLLLLSFIIMSQFAFAQKLKVTIYNKTGEDLDTVSLADNLIPHIPKGGKITVKDCKEFAIQGGQPYGMVSGSIKGKRSSVKELRLCGTGIEVVDSGKYEFDITMVEAEEGFELWWAPHK